MDIKKNSIWIYDANDSTYLLTVVCEEELLNFEIFDNKIKVGEVGIKLKDVDELEYIIKTFKKIQSQSNKPKSKAGRKRIYEGETETLSIHVPSEKKEFIRSIVEAILEPMKIKK
jgi:hypothetical protein